MRTEMKIACALVGAALVAALIGGVAPVEASTKQSQESTPSLLNRDTLTNNWFGAEGALVEHGLFIDLGLTHIYQHNLQSGLREDIGRHSGSYDLEIDVDLERAVGLESTRLYVHGEGSWLENEGLDAEAVGSIFGINADQAPDRSLDVTELWLQRSFLRDKIQLRAGKLDLTGGFQCRGCPVTFDGNQFANDETTQFLNGALVNNPTIPFPDPGIAAIVHFNPVPWWYLGAGIGDAEADARETGLNTAFDGDSKYVYLFETGFVPRISSSKGGLSGAYRIGVWHENQSKPHLDGTGSKSEDTGVYLSAGQMLWLENKIDDQGLGVFCRAGWTDDKVNEVEHFASTGLRYKGLIPHRDQDTMGIGFAWGGLSEAAEAEEPFERVVEMYYKAQITPWLNISPDLQVVSNPGGDEGSDDAVVAGVRVQLDI